MCPARAKPHDEGRHFIPAGVVQNWRNIPQMLPARFNAEEKSFLLSRIDEWDELEGLGRERNSEGDIINPRDEFISDLIEAFFDRFPGRDSSRQPTSLTAFSPKERDRLHMASFRMISLTAIAESSRRFSRSFFTVRALGIRMRNPQRQDAQNIYLCLGFSSNDLGTESYKSGIELNHPSRTFYARITQLWQPSLRSSG